jgi:protein-arginine deiminase
VACDDTTKKPSTGDVEDSGEVEPPPTFTPPEEIAGVANLDDDNENGEFDWDDQRADDGELVPVGLTVEDFALLEEGSTLALTFEGDISEIRVWLDDSVVLDADNTTLDVSTGDELEAMSVEFALPSSVGQLVFTHLDSTGAEVESWTVHLQSAPLILNHHHQQAEWVNAVDAGTGRYGNADFIDGFEAELGSDFRTEDGRNVGYDVWMQDEIEFGTLTAPGYEIDFVIDSIRSQRGQYLDSYPEAELFGPDFAMYTWGSGGATSQDSFGNLEVSPPVTVDGVDYPFGRIYYGDSGRYAMNSAIQDMFVAQKVQAPFTLDIGWLCVGHVDEFITMLPDPDAPKGFRVWVADVDEGRSFLESLPAGKTLNKYASDHGLSSAGEMLEDAALWSYNRDLMDENIEPNINVLKRELGLDESDFVRVPGIFERSRMCGGLALALIPATVNMQVTTHEDGVGATLFIPDPFMRSNSEGQSDDPFIEYFDSLLPSNLDPIWLDDWDAYHMAWGEVHCGSNTVRSPGGQWWTEARHLMED